MSHNIQERFGRHETRELIRNGSNIELTESNKSEYIQKMIEFRLTHGVKHQMDGLAYGFMEGFELEIPSGCG